MTGKEGVMIKGIDDIHECYLLTSSKKRELIGWCQDSATAKAKRMDDACILEAGLSDNGHTNSARGAMLLGNKLLSGEVMPEAGKNTNIEPCESSAEEEEKYE